jgi:4-hydroxybenzoyl-CoA thioesterase
VGSNNLPFIPAQSGIQSIFYSIGAGCPLARGRPDEGIDAVTAFSNTRQVRIEWGDCDPAGIIYYPRYFEIFDASTTLLFERVLGMTKFNMFKHFDFDGFPLVRTRARFLKPTRFGDDVTVKSMIEFGRSSFDVEHQLSLDGDTCVECSEKRVWVGRDANGRLNSQPVPEIVLAKFRGASQRR